MLIHNLVLRMCDTQHFFSSGGETEIKKPKKFVANAQNSHRHILFNKKCLLKTVKTKATVFQSEFVKSLNNTIFENHIMGLR